MPDQGVSDELVARALQHAQIGSSDNVYKRTLLNLMRSCPAFSQDDESRTTSPETMLETFVQVLDIIYIVEKNQHTALLEHNAQLTADLEKSVKEFSQLQCAVVDLVHLIGPTQNSKSPLDMCVSVGAAIKELKAKLQIFDGQRLDDIYHDVVKYTTENELLKKQNRSLVEALRGRDKELEELSARITKADAELLQLHQQHEQASKDAETRLVEAERSSQVLIQELQQQLQAQQTNLDKIKQQRAAMETRAEKAEAQLVDAQELAEQEKKELQIDIKLLKQQIAQLCAQLESGKR